MRILVLSNLYPPHYIGGYELRCAALTEALRGRGHEMRVLTSDHGVGPGAEEKDGVARRLRIHGYYGHPWLGPAPLRKLEFHNNATLRDEVAAFRPDIVHVWCLGGLSKSLCLTLQDLGLPVAYDVSDHWILRSLAADVWLDWWNRSGGGLSSRMLRTAWTMAGLRRAWQKQAPTNPVRHIRFQRVYFTSARLRELTVEKGYDVGHGEVIHCPVDTNRFQGEPVPADRPLRRWLWVGRLAEDKGILTALKAMKLAAGRVEGELHVYGKGDADYVRMLEGFVAEHSLPVRFEHAEAGRMPEIYRSHDALLFTSEWEEPFALTPLEGMASGLPVIGTMTGGSRELFRHGENALTYEAGDAAALAERMAVLAADGGMRARLAAAGHQEVRARFSMPAITDQTEDFLKRAIREWKPESLPCYNEP